MGEEKISCARKLRNIKISMIRTIMDRSKEMAQSGLPVVPLVAGEPNFDTPQAIKEAVIEAIRENESHYASNRGYPPLRREISRWTQKTVGLSYDPESEILVTSGGAEAINNALTAYLEPGDEIIVFTPAFVNYANVAVLSGATVVPVPLRVEDGMQINVDRVREVLTPRTKMIVVNNPCNPTGAVYSHETLQALCGLICERDLLAFSDEIYSTLVYDGRFESLASFPGMRGRTIVMNGFSKAFAMTGWRLGWLCAEKQRISDILKVHQYSTTCSPTFIQVGLARSMNADETGRETAQMARAFAARRQRVMEGLDTVEAIRYIPPSGAFYCFADVSGTGLSGEDFARRLLEEQYVATVPGVGFSEECGGFVRISYAASGEAVAEGMRRIAEFVRSL